MSDKSELKAELERKKQRIAQIREEKKRKEEEKKKKDVRMWLLYTVMTCLLCVYSIFLVIAYYKSYPRVILKRGVETGGASSAGREDSDLERKRREAEALLQSVGITPDVPHGKPTSTFKKSQFTAPTPWIYCLVVWWICRHL